MRNERNNGGMSLVVKTVTAMLKGLILLFGVYIVLYGHLTPGGGFSGGVVIACAFVLLTLAEGQRVGLRTITKGLASELDSVGALLFLGIAVAGMCYLNVFFKNVPTSEGQYFALISGGAIPLSNIGIGLKVGMSLFMVFTILAAVKITLKSTGDRTERDEDR